MTNEFKINDVIPLAEESDCAPLTIHDIKIPVKIRPNNIRKTCFAYSV